MYLYTINIYVYTHICYSIYKITPVCVYIFVYIYMCVSILPSE